MCLTVFVLQKTGLTGFLQTSHMAENTLSAYHLYRKPGNSGENSNGTVHRGGNFPEKKWYFSRYYAFNETAEIFCTICLDY